MATNFVSYRTCSLGAEVFQDPLARFSQSLQHMVGIELQMINRPSFSNTLMDVDMATNYVAKLWQNYLPPHLSLCHSETEWDITVGINCRFWTTSTSGFRHLGRMNERTRVKSI